jgi:hypothetical protein
LSHRRRKMLMSEVLYVAVTSDTNWISIEFDG